MSVGGEEEQVLSLKHFSLKRLGDKELLAKRPGGRASEGRRKPGECAVLGAQGGNYLKEPMSKV